MNYKLICILIPIHNGLEFTKKSLENLAVCLNNVKEEQVKYEIIVIDDGSTDGSSDWIKAHHPEVHLLYGDGNLWWSGGINVGAKYSIEELKCDFVLLWNNDVKIDADYIRNLNNTLTTLDNKTIIGSKIFSSLSDRIIWSYGGYFNPKNGIKRMIGLNEKDGENYNKPLEVDWLTGMGTLIPANTIDTIGYWDEKKFPQYFGDSDFTYRAKKAGYKILAIPSLEIWNDLSNTGIVHGLSFKKLWKSLFSMRSYYNIKDNIAFYKRHANNILSYRGLISKYFLYIGGYFKHSVLKSR